MTTTASVMQMLFDTMPLAGVRSAFPNLATLTWEAVKVKDLKRYLEYTNWSKVGTVDESSSAGGLPNAAKIWGFTADASDPAVITNVTCRPRLMGFSKYQVLEKLEYGSTTADSPESFEHKVVVTYEGVRYDLPLEDKFWIASFVTRDGHNRPGVNALWPDERYHDRSVVHAFLYDLDVAGMWASAYPVSPSVLAQFRATCEHLGHPDALTNDAWARDFLFTDTLWAASAPTAPAAVSVPGHATVKARIPRVLVTCSLTVCREENDFFPGRVVAVGRFFPHIMVASTVPLNKETDRGDGTKIKDGIEAGVRLTRPAKTMMIPDTAGQGHNMAMHGMKNVIGSLLVADTNAGNQMIDTRAGLPLTYWANLFNYYVEAPENDSALRGKAIQVVYPSSNAAMNKRRRLEGAGVVDRDCNDILQVKIPDWLDPFVGPAPESLPENRTRVTKLPLQGAFDNIHLAPRMSVTAKIDDAVTIGATGGKGGVAKFVSYADWKMDNLVMAPFCAHDCMHMHWRWTDYANTLKSAHGFVGRQPSSAPGTPMVPDNHAAWIVVSSANKYTYFGRAESCTGEWECFVWHGGGYGLSGKLGEAVNGFVVDTAMRAIRTLCGTHFRADAMTSLSAVVNLTDWALFYWCNRYTLSIDSSGSATVFERFKFIRRQQVLDL